MTIFRKLSALGYRSSYSHRGRFYTLADIPEFDDQGLWSFREVYFSKDGTLLSTAQRIVEESEAGVTVNELRELLHVEAKESLLHLYRTKRIAREIIDDVYVYLSSEGGVRLVQTKRRRAPNTIWELGESPISQKTAPELKAAIILFYSLLDEQQRRLYTGLEAHKLGHGGDRRVAEFFGVDDHTVARGRREIFSAQVLRQGVRTKGGGRKRIEKKHPT